MRALPERTAALLRAIDALPEAEGLVLAGGTALALRIEHRRSEDLDFVFASAKLPRRRITALLDALRREHPIKAIPNPAAEQDLLNEGLELADYQQDYSVDGVKLTFFVPEMREPAQHIHAEKGLTGLRRILVADLHSLFLLKSIALNGRTTLRDYYDVYTLLEQHGFRFDAVLAAADAHGHSADTLKMRLINSKPGADDSGVELLEGLAPAFEALRAYFANAIDLQERTRAGLSK